MRRHLITYPAKALRPMAYIINGNKNSRYTGYRTEEFPPREYTREYHGELNKDEGVPVPEHLLPRKIRLTRGTRLFDFNVYFPVLVGVSERFKNLIDSIEPNVHQFVPVEVFHKDGTPYSEPIWQMNICSRIDAIALEHSDMHRVGTKSGLYWYDYNPGGTRVSVYKDRVSGRAMWRDCRYGINYIFFGNDVIEGMKNQGMEGVQISHHIDEV